jgi:predicted RNA-binding Zn ribbon-like protein
MTAAGAELRAWSRDGGHPALDFVNTVDWRGTPTPIDYLANYASLLDWAADMALIASREASALERRAKAQPRRAAAAFRDAVELRETCHRLFQAGVRSEPAGADDLAALNQVLRRLPQKSAILPSGRRYVWQSPDRAEPLERVIGAVARAAAELMTSAAYARLRLCEAEGCGWLFLDTSPNRSRRWCSMKSCGNRAKAQRHYARWRKTEP